MQICGFIKTTLLDYPEHLASAIFLGGCNFRCPFCQNGDLLSDSDSRFHYSKKEILTHLKKRRGILDGVCVSGGEPTLSPDLLSFLEEIKALGYLIKLDTNGSNPSVVQEGIRRGLIDYVAMDIKSSRDSYAVLCGTKNIDIASIEQTIQILQTIGIKHEFRTTLVKPYHNETIIRDIGSWIAGDSSYYLQQFRQSDGVIEQGLSAFSQEEMQHFKQILLPFLPNTHLRGMEDAHENTL